MIYSKSENQATIFINRGPGSFNALHRKENSFSGEYKAIDQKTGNSLAIVRVYWTRSRCYACAWFYGKNSVYLSGSGYAGGGGYCKESAAIGEAIRKANINLESRIDGRGTNEAEKAIVSIGLALNGGQPVIFTKSNA